MVNKGLDQMGAWMLAALFAGGIFGGVYLAAKAVNKHSADEATEADESSDHKKSEGEGHAEKGEHGAEHEEHKEASEEAKSEHEEKAGSEEHTAAGAGHDSVKEEHEKSAGDHEGGSVKGHGEDTKKANRGDAVHEQDGHAKGEGEDDAAEGHTSGTHTASNASPGDAKNEPRWSYRGSEGPDSWGDLSDDYVKCKSGKQQSPVDIDHASMSSKLQPLKIHYRADDVSIHNDGNGIALSFEKGQYVEIEGDRFDLQQAFFHTPSEHKIAGVPYDMEIQLVHRSGAGGVAVLALLLEEGKANASLERLWHAFPASAGKKAAANFDLNTLLPKKLHYYQYAGSLTTPPCREGVHWYVMTEPIVVGTKQVDFFVSLINFNARPVQPLLSRRIQKSSR